MIKPGGGGGEEARVATALLSLAVRAPDLSPQRLLATTPFPGGARAFSLPVRRLRAVNTAVLNSTRRMTRTRRSSTGEGTLPVAFCCLFLYTQSEVIRATLLEDDPCLLHGL